MNVRRKSPFLASTALLAGMALPIPARTANDIPALPLAPVNPPFEDQLAGRKLLFAARDAYRAAPALRLSAQWTIKTDRGNTTEVTSGRETIDAEPAARRLALATESDPPASGKDIHRTLCDGSSLLATHFQARPGAKEPTREFMRLTLTPKDTLSNALQQLQVVPSTQAAVLLLHPDWTVQGMTWRGRGDHVNGIAADEVWDTEVPYPRNAAKRRAVAETRRRYLLDPLTHLLLRYEEWATAEPSIVAGRSAKGNYPRIVYRREDYERARVSQDSLPGKLFDQTLPARYRETALPSVPLSASSSPFGEADAEAHRLLVRWARLQDRLLSYSAQIEVTTRWENANPRAPVKPKRAGGPNSSVLYTVRLQKPGRLHLMREDTGAPGQGTKPLLAVADGEQLSLQDRRDNAGSHKVRILPLPDPVQLGIYLGKTGFDDQIGALSWIFEGPAYNYDQAVYRGRQPLDGGTVDILDLIEDVNGGRKNRGGKARIITSIALGADGLPRRIERRFERSASRSGADIQVLGPIVTAHYRRVEVDVEPPGGSFTLLLAERAAAP